MLREGMVRRLLPLDVQLRNGELVLQCRIRLAGIDDLERVLLYKDRSRRLVLSCALQRGHSQNMRIW